MAAVANRGRGRHPRRSRVKRISTRPTFTSSNANSLRVNQGRQRIRTGTGENQNVFVFSNTQTNYNVFRTKSDLEIQRVGGSGHPPPSSIHPAVSAVLSAANKTPAGFSLAIGKSATLTPVIVEEKQKQPLQQQPPPPPAHSSLLPQGKKKCAEEPLDLGSKPPPVKIFKIEDDDDSKDDVKVEAVVETKGMKIEKSPSIDAKSETTVE